MGSFALFSPLECTDCGRYLPRMRGQVDHCAACDGQRRQRSVLDLIRIRGRIMDGDFYKKLGLFLSYDERHRCQLHFLEMVLLSHASPFRRLTFFGNPSGGALFSMYDNVLDLVFSFLETDAERRLNPACN